MSEQSTGPNRLALAAIALMLLLLGAIVIALAAWVIEGRIGWPVDAVVIAVVIALNAVLGFVQQARAEQAVAALARMTAATSTVHVAGW